MAEKEMYDYLSDTVADYTTTTLSVTCQVELKETGNKTQVYHKFDDGSISVSTLSDSSYFDADLQWPNGISKSDAGTIMDFWHDANKANGGENTIYWEHPVDGHTYIIRFMGPLTRKWVAGFTNHMQIPAVPVRIEGRKAEA